MHTLVKTVKLKTYYWKPYCRCKIIIYAVKNCQKCDEAQNYYHERPFLYDFCIRFLYYFIPTILYELFYTVFHTSVTF